MSIEIKSNMAIWDSVCKTDSEYTKKVNQRGGYTAIDATYQQMKATELFGSYGFGWGLREISYDFTLFEATKMVLCHAVFFYKLNGTEASFPISNAISAMLGAAKPDEDFCKKLETNTISKALSRLGFSADVFLGLFDDQEYIAQLKTEEAIAKAEDKDAEIAAKRAETSDYVLRHIETIKTAKSQNEVKGIAKAATLHLTRQKLILSIADICEKGVAAIARESEAKLKELAQ
jgi:hypothetical protein